MLPSGDKLFFVNASDSLGKSKVSEIAGGAGCGWVWWWVGCSQVAAATRGPKSGEGWPKLARTLRFGPPLALWLQASRAGDGAEDAGGCRVTAPQAVTTRAGMRQG